MCGMLNQIIPIYELKHNMKLNPSTYKSQFRNILKEHEMKVKLEPIMLLNLPISYSF